MKKRTCYRFTLAITSVLIALLASITMAGAVFCNDVSTSHWARNAINYVTDNGYMNTSNGSFNPSGTVSRGMMVQILYAKAGSPIVTYRPIFSDVPRSAYYAKAVTWAYDFGIVSGTSSTTFSPNTAVTRQDAMCLLNRFSGYLYYDTQAEASITGYSDWTSVASYALHSVKWGVSHGLITSTSTTANLISPTGTLTRAQIALMLTNFGTNVEKINFSKDSYSFANSDSVFTNSGYYMSGTHISRLQNQIQQAYPANYTSIIAEINAVRNANYWGGACFGMSASVVFDKKGFVDINGNYSNFNTIHEFPGNALAGSSLESAINFYQLSQYAPRIRAQWEHVTSPILSMIIDAYNAVINNKGIAVMTYTWPTLPGVYYRHAVVVYDAYISNGKYVFKVYDPNRPGGYVEMRIAGGGATTFVPHNGGDPIPSANLRDINVITDLSDYSLIDIDGPWNNNTAATTSAPMPNQQEAVSGDVCYIYAQLSGEFSITTKEGQRLYWDGQTLSSGDCDYYLIAKTGPAEICIAAPNSEEYTIQCMTEGMESKFSFAGPDSYIRFSGSGIEGAAVNCKDEVVDLLGGEMDCQVVLADSVKKTLLYGIQGTSTEKTSVSLCTDDNNKKFALTCQGLAPTEGWMITEDGTRVDNVKLVEAQA